MVKAIKKAPGHVQSPFKEVEIQTEWANKYHTWISIILEDDRETNNNGGWDGIVDDAS